MTAFYGVTRRTGRRLGGAYVKRLRKLDTWWVDLFSDTRQRYGPGRRKHEKGPGLISRTLGGCRRGRSGVRPLRQPVATRLLKISQKMNPKHFGGKSGRLRRRNPVPASCDPSETSSFDETDQRRLDRQQRGNISLQRRTATEQRVDPM
jgi:hypothetical protein